MSDSTPSRMVNSARSHAYPVVPNFSIYCSGASPSEGTPSWPKETLLGFALDPPGLGQIVFGAPEDLTDGKS